MSQVRTVFRLNQSVLNHIIQRVQKYKIFKERKKGLENGLVCYWAIIALMGQSDASPFCQLLLNPKLEGRSPLQIYYCFCFLFINFPFRTNHDSHSLLLIAVPFPLSHQTDER